MQRRTSSRLLAVFAASLILLAAGGCWPLLAADGAASFAAGWFARGLADGNPTTTCYVNGQLTDCSNLPAGMVP